jgi:hypothetical protein
MYEWIRLVCSGFGTSTCPEGAHILHLYSDDAERRSEIAGFVDAGHVAGDRVLYYADSRVEDMDQWATVTGLGENLADTGSQVEVLRACDVYCQSGTFDPDLMMERLSALYLESLEAGHRGLRVTGEMTWALSGIQGSERLAEYERRVNDVFATYPITAVCQYDINRFSPDLLNDLIRSHPYIVENGQVIRNPGFEEQAAGQPS